MRHAGENANDFNDPRRTSNLRVGSSNLSERASKINELAALALFGNDL